MSTLTPQLFGHLSHPQRAREHRQWSPYIDQVDFFGASFRHLRVSTDTRHDGVMPDTHIGSTGVLDDTDHRYKLTRSAVERAKARHGLRNDEAVWTAMRLSRRTFYRLLAGTYDIRLSEARAFADWIGWPLGTAFERMSRG